MLATLVAVGGPALGARHARSTTTIASPCSSFPSRPAAQPTFARQHGDAFFASTSIFNAHCFDTNSTIAIAITNAPLPLTNTPLLQQLFRLCTSIRAVFILFPADFSSKARHCTSRQLVHDSIQHLAILVRQSCTVTQHVLPTAATIHCRLSLPTLSETIPFYLLTHHNVWPQ